MTAPQDSYPPGFSWDYHSATRQILPKPLVCPHAAAKPHPTGWIAGAASILTEYLRLLVVVTGLLLIGPALGQEVQYVGIPRTSMEYSASNQRNSQWCWAASIQMVFNYYGVDIQQEQIVGRTYGTDPYGQLPNWGGNFENITRNLNNWSVDNQGRPYVVSARLGQGAPTPAILLAELSQQRPVIVAYASGPSSGHAVVVTGASYSTSPYGPIIQSIIVRDPWPSPENVSNRGRVEYPGAIFAQRMQHYWYVSISRAR